jgi:hypothetical protein
MRFQRARFFGVRLPTLILALLAPPLMADEAILPDGKRLNGTAHFPADGRLHFTSDKRDLRLDELDEIRLPAADQTPLTTSTVHCLMFRDGQRLTGELLGLDDTNARLVTAWAAKPLSVPRARITAITHLPGQVTLFDDDFEADSKAWQLTGKASLSDKEKTSGKRSLLLDAPGQSAELSVTSQPTAGRASINFLDPGPTPAARWVVEAEFAAAERPGLVQVAVVGPGDRYALLVPAEGAVKVDRVRKPGWHRLEIGFSVDRLRILVDNRVLWETDKHGPGGPLRSLRLKCVQEKERGGESGQVWFDDCSIAQAVGSLRRPDGDLSQDEVWLVAGDQLFGKVARADRRAIELEGRFGKKSIPWYESRGTYLHLESATSRSTDGEHVRVWVRPGAGSDLDQLEGVIKSLDGRRLTLDSPASGEITIELGRLRQIRWNFYGRRLEIDNGLYHLGNSPCADFILPRPEGLSLRKTFVLKEIPQTIRVAVQVAHLKGPGDGQKIARALAAGGRRTEVLLNGKPVEYLNRLVERSSADFRTLRVGLPREALKMGENVLEIRQTSDPETGQYEDCLIGGLALEMPR